MPDDWEERGNVDKRREDVENERGYRAPSDREGYSARTDFYREDAPNRFARIDSARQGGALGQIFKLGITALGAYGAYRFLHRTPMGAEFAEWLAKGGRSVRRLWNKQAARIADSQAWRDPGARELAATLRETGTSRLGAVEKIKHLKEKIDVVNRRKSVGIDLMKTDLGGVLRDSFITKGHAPPGMKMLTFGDIITDKAARSLVGRQQQEIIHQGIDLGLITEKTVVGEGLFRASSGIKDTRAFLGRNIAQFAKKVLDQIQIPVINWKMSSIITRPMQILGKHRGVMELKAGTRIPGVGKVAIGNALLIDGTVWALKARGGYSKVAEGVKPLFRSEFKDLFRVAGAMYDDYRPPIFTGGGPVKNAIGWIEKHTGVGPAYRTEKSVLTKLFLDPIRRLTRGQPVLKEKIERKFATENPFDSMVNHMLETGGHVPKEFGKVDNIYSAMEDMGPLRRGWDKLRAAFTGRGRYTKYTDPTNLEGKIKGLANPKPGFAFPGEDMVLMRKEHKWHMLANWMSTRPQDLLSWTTGIAYKPGTGLHGWAKNTARLFGIWHGANIGVEAAKYLDYQLEDLTGFSPIKGAASAYVGLRLFQKNVADLAGITDAAQYAEDLMPLSMSSTGSGAARTFLPWLLGGIMGGKKGVAIGGAVSLLTGGPAQLFWPEDITKDAEMYREELTGERKVPVRANRWWEFNAEEFSGGRIKYFKPHWYAEMMSDYQFTDVKYGSEANYWKKVSNLPTPSNLFGLKKLLDPGWLGEVHASDRPYPVVPGMDHVARGSLVAGASADGIGAAANPNDLQSKFNEVFESGTEFLGLYKFLGESILGIQAPFKHETALASSEEMTSLHHQFWESDMGGLLGMTELLRRFILPRNAMAKSYNPLPNLMPSWLPGDRALFDEDQRYFLNFHRGDPYRAVPHGEYRMPGPGYEALHRMHSGQPGVYDAFDRYKILADVAPYSRAFSHYRTIVQSWAKAGVLDDYWGKQYQMTEAELSAKKEGGRFTERRFTGKDRMMDAQNEAIKYNGFERAVGAAWEYATHDIIGSIPLIGTKLLRARTPYKAYLEEQVYGETFKNWADPYGAFIKPHFQMAISEDPLSGAGRGAMAMYLGANPISKAILGVAGAAIGGIGSAARAATTGQWEGGWVPGEREEEWAHMEYMDRLQYVRAKRLQGMAQLEGQSADALYWKGQAERTMTGLPANASIGQMQAAMPPHLKKYFRGLLGSRPELRGELMPMLPTHVRPAFARMWGQENNAQAPEDIAADYFRTHELPADNWLGWHPSVPFSVSKIKMVDTAEGSPSTRLHHYGLWETELDDHHLIYREMEAPPMEASPLLSSDTEQADALRSELSAINRGFFRTRPQFGYSRQYQMNITFDNKRTLYNYTDDFLRRA